MRVLRALGYGVLWALPGAAIFGLAMFIDSLGIVSSDTAQAGLIGIPLAFGGFFLGLIRGPSPGEPPRLPSA